MAQRTEFTKAELGALRAAYRGIDRIDPDCQGYTGLRETLDNCSDDALEQLNAAKIKFVSTLARNRIIARMYPKEN